jgi:hypothetical protein
MELVELYDCLIRVGVLYGVSHRTVDKTSTIG